MTGTQPNAASGGNGMGLTIPPGTEPSKINELMAYARHSAEELRRQGIPERVIATVENNRGILETSLRAQQNFHGSLTRQQPMGGNGNLGPVPGLQPGNLFPKTPQIASGQPMATASPSQQPTHSQGQPGPGNQHQSQQIQHQA